MASCMSLSSVGPRPSRGASPSSRRRTTMNDIQKTSESSNVPARSDERRFTDATLTPPVDVIEDSSGITLYADLPGVPRDKLHLNVESDVLTIEGEIDLSVPEGLQSSHTEVGLGRFHRTF